MFSFRDLAADPKARGKGEKEREERRKKKKKKNDEEEEQDFDKRSKQPEIIWLSAVEAMSLLVSVSSDTFYGTGRLKEEERDASTMGV